VARLIDGAFYLNIQYASRHGTIDISHLFLSYGHAVLIVSTHCTYSQVDGQAELAWVAGYSTIHNTSLRGLILTEKQNSRYKTWKVVH